jgi:hypothetical protein
LKEVILYLIYVMSYKCFILTKKNTFGHIMLRLSLLLLKNENAFVKLYIYFFKIDKLKFRILKFSFFERSIVLDL